MKKIYAILLILTMAFSFSACLEDSPKKEEFSATETASKKEETFGLNETAVFDNLKITATEMKVSHGESFFTPQSGNVFVGVKFIVENISKEEQAISSLLLFNGYVDDVKCEYSLSAAGAFSEGTIDGTIAPGKKLIGWYALEVPENYQIIELQVLSNLFANNPAKFVLKR
ncbi:MAG: DUF4352 domain-containing protein [Oscillospiraceae bacterium]|nr:DUF4352 domain-containing protein [Oscillospiraceae bacterium]